MVGIALIMLIIYGLSNYMLLIIHDDEPMLIYTKNMTTGITINSVLLCAALTLTLIMRY